jgi:N-methylhydantoinase A
VRTLLLPAGEIDGDAVAAAYESLADEARAALAEEGIAFETVTLSRLADLRYAGQAYELTVRVPDGPVDVKRLTLDFAAEHERTYGHGSTEDPVDLVSVRVVAQVEGRALAGRLVPSETEGAGGEMVTRRAYFGPDVGLLDVPVIDRATLEGVELNGPLFVDEYDSSTVIPPGCSAALDAFGSINIDVG